MPTPNIYIYIYIYIYMTVYLSDEHKLRSVVEKKPNGDI